MNPRRPPALRKLEGSKTTMPGIQINNSEGIPLDGCPVPPKGTTKKGKKFWEATVVGLYNMGMLSTTDLPGLESMLYAYEELVICQDQLKTFDKLHAGEDPALYAKDRGYLHRQYITAQSEFTKLLGRFGCTPSDRTRLPIVESDTDNKDPLSMILGD